MELKVIYKSIADRVRGKAMTQMPIHWISQKEVRFILERVVKEFGGIKVFSDQDEDSSAYNILGTEDYVFIDRSVVRLVGSKSYTIDIFMPIRTVDLHFEAYKTSSIRKEVEKSIDKQLSRISGLKTMQLKVKYLVKLPIGEGY
jgi:hypothetical protein